MRVASCVLLAATVAGAVLLFQVLLFQVLLFQGSAAARIRLNDAEIVADVLVVSGRTRHRYEAIALDDRAARKSDRNRRFVFRIPYYPITLRTAEDGRVATVASCGGRGPGLSAALFGRDRRLARCPLA
jgi:hypothetical protein